MSQIINELATIEVSNEVLQHLDIAGIYQSFSKNYRKLDDLKNFRTEYEKKNGLMRWWHNDKLQDAQLDSAEVQAEFSKTIGQLMMISIMQSKKLSEQQTQLNDQQGKLKTQADGIAKHADKLQEQHQVLADQSKKLETLVREYFDLKGLTEEGAQKLIEIAHEAKATKSQMLQEFASHTKGVEAVCAEVQSHMESISAQIDARIHLSEEKTQKDISGIQRDTREALASFESSQNVYQKTVQNALNQGLEQLAKSQREAAVEVQSHMEGISAEIDARIHLSEEKTQTDISGIQRDTREALASFESSQNVYQKTVQNALNQGLEQLEKSQREAAAEVQTKQADLESRVSDLSDKHDHHFAAYQEKQGSIDAALEGMSAQAAGLATAIAGMKADLTKSVEQQQTHQDTMAVFQQEIFHSLKRLRYFSVGMSIVVIGLLGSMVYIMK